MHLNTMILRVGALCFLAVAGSGYALQSFMAPEGAVGGTVVGVDATQAVVSASLMPDRGAQDRMNDAGGAQFAALDGGPDVPLRARSLDTMTVTPAAPDCSIGLRLSAAPAGMIDLNLSAPCDPRARVLVEHAGLTFTLQTSATGAAQVMLPAMTTTAEVSVVFDDGRMTRETVAVPAAAAYDRVAVQWQGNDAFALQAYEFGAEFGMPGHIHRANPTATGADVSGRMITLGDPAVLWPLQAEVYTYPAAYRLADGAIRLETEAMITEHTCARQVTAKTIAAKAGVVQPVVEIGATLPPCDGTDGFIVLRHDLGLTRNALN
ncbi:hypothetical protein [Roseicitreum antarcticum]|nr:hypothetical protein [Roseicitreum antarcticum]